jgi:hypothetical protein
MAAWVVPMALRPVKLEQAKRGIEMDVEMCEIPDRKVSVRQVFGIESDLEVPAVNVALG